MTEGGEEEYGAERRVQEGREDNESVPSKHWWFR